MIPTQLSSHISSLSKMRRIVCTEVQQREGTAGKTPTGKEKTAAEVTARLAAGVESIPEINTYP